MKSCFVGFAILVAVILATYAPVASADQRGGHDTRPAVAVVEFRNDTNAGWWRSSDVGRELSNMLSNEMAATGAFRMLDRKHLGATLREQDLAASGRMREGSGPATGDLIGAEYLVEGTVTSYSEHTSKTGGGFSFKGIRLGGKRTEAYIAIDLQVVDSQTGVIAYTRTVEGHSSGGGVDIGVYRGGFGGTLAHESNTPAGKAIRAALIEATDYLACVMVDRTRSCLNKYNVRDQRRRSNTRSAISLD